MLFQKLFRSKIVVFQNFIKKRFEIRWKIKRVTFHSTLNFQKNGGSFQILSVFSNTHIHIHALETQHIGNQTSQT